jgi:hypothetical protein
MKSPIDLPNKYRIVHGMFKSSIDDGCNGCFVIPFETNFLTIIVSDGSGWEHVSVSLENRCPNWKEMCFIKSLFWEDEECVIQFHPPKSVHVNNHNFCLHLWKKIGEEFQLPDIILV